MRVPFSLFMAWRYWRSKTGDRFGRGIMRLASTGIALGIMALIIMLAVMNGLQAMQKNERLSSLPQLVISPASGNSPITELAKVQKIINETPDLQRQITHVAPITQSQVVVQTAHSIQAGTLIGVENPSDAPQLAFYSKQAMSEFLPKNRFNILVSQRFAAQAELNVGDKVRLMLTDQSRYTPFGQLPVERLFRVSGIFPSDGDDTATLFTNLADINRLRHIKAIHGTPAVQGFRLFLRDPFQVEEIESALQRIAPSWRFSDWRAQKGELFQAIKMERNMMILLVGLIVLVAISNILTSLSLMVVDKRREVAILQTQGLTLRAVGWIFIFQGLLVGALGTVIGFILGVAGCQLLPNLLEYSGLALRLPVLLDWSQTLWVLAGAMSFSLLATLYPAYRAAKIQPAVALRDE